MHNPILITQSLTIGYTYPRRPARIVAEDISLSLAGGELVCLLGPNGAGKSTLLRTLSGIQPPLAGQVKLRGENIHHLKPRQLARYISLVLTERVEVGALSAYELATLGRHPYTDWSGRLTAADEVVVRQALQTVGAVELATRQVSELSDGERQKIMIARALAQEPTLMILDEPTAFLDLPRRVEVMRLLRRLAHEQGRAVLLSTHDLDLALRSADRVWLMAQDGALQPGAPEDLVLSGAFQSVFHSEGVQFDPASGAFRVNEPPTATIKLSGEGLSALWTGRALERAGFQVISAAEPAPPATPQVILSDSDGAPGWFLTLAEATYHCASIEALILRLQQEVNHC